MTRVAAIDQGTSSTKLVVLSADGTVAVPHRAGHATRYPRPGWVEQDAAELLAGIRACLAAAGPVSAIGIGNQGESCLAWDAVTGDPLSPVIVWQDRRTDGRVAALKRDGAEAATRARAGLPLDGYFSATKLGWLVAEVPEVGRALRDGRLRLGTTDAFFLDRLAGRFATDLSTASRTCLLDIRTGRWDDELCSLFGVPLECLPEILPSVGAFGAIGGVPVTAAIVDQQASLYGHGGRRPGDAKVTFGTGAFALAVSGTSFADAPGSGLVPTVAWAEGGEVTYALEGGVLEAGSAVAWACRLGILRRPEDLASLLAAPPAIGRGLAFVPALSGLGSPHWDGRAGGLWIGMTGATSATDLCQALVEGIAFRVAEVLDALEDCAAAPEGGGVGVDGGLARSDYLVQFLADLSDRPVVRPDFGDLTGLGTALLAARGAGLETAAPVVDRAVFTPRRGDARAWRDRFRDAIGRSAGWH